MRNDAEGHVSRPQPTDSPTQIKRSTYLGGPHREKFTVPLGFNVQRSAFGSHRTCENISAGTNAGLTANAESTFSICVNSNICLSMATIRDASIHSSPKCSQKRTYAQLKDVTVWCLASAFAMSMFAMSITPREPLIRLGYPVLGVACVRPTHPAKARIS